MKKLLFVGLLLVSFNTFGQTNVTKNYTAPHFQGSVKVEDTLGIVNKLLVDTIKGFSSSNIIISDNMRVSGRGVFNGAVDDISIAFKSIDGLSSSIINLGFRSIFTSTGTGNQNPIAGQFHVQYNPGLSPTVPAFMAGSDILALTAQNNGASIAEVIGGRFRVGAVINDVGATDAIGVKIDTPFNVVETLPTNTIGIKIANQGEAGITATTGLLIEDQTNSTTTHAIKTGLGLVEFGDNVTIAGDADIAKQIAIRAVASIDNNILLNLSETITSSADSRGIFSSVTLSSTSATIDVIGASFSATMSGTTGGSEIIGAEIKATANVTAGTAPTLTGLSIKLATGPMALSPAFATVLQLESPSFISVTPLIIDGIDIANQGKSGTLTSTAINIADQTGSTNNFAIKTGTGLVEFGGDLVVNGNVTGDTAKFLNYSGQSDFSIGKTGDNITIGADTVIITGNMVTGNGAAGVDYRIDFDGETNDGSIIYMEDEDRFDFDNDVNIVNDLTVLGTNSGFGTSSPNAALEVRGTPGAAIGGFPSGQFHVTSLSADVNANSVITGHNLNGGNKQLWYLGSVSSSNDNIAFINRQNATLSFSTNSITRMTIGASGLVSITNDLTVLGTTILDNNAANTSAIVTFENTAGDIQLFRTDATPKGAVTGSIGDIAVDGTNGFFHIKKSGSATNTGWQIIGGASTFKSYSLSNPGNAGTFYVGGHYAFDAADANLTIGGTVIQTFGTAGEAHGSHAFAVASGPGGTDLVLTLTGVSITDAGVRNDADSEILIADADAAITDQYFETSKKWLGQITYTLTGAAGTFDFNYGFVKYDDFGNRDFTVTDFEGTGEARANETGLNIELLHHEATAFIYNATAFVPNQTALVSLATDYGTNNDVANGDGFAYKRNNLSTSINGNNGEGLIIRITTVVNNSINDASFQIGVTLK